MIFSLDITTLLNSSLFFTNIPTNSLQTYIFTFLIKPTINSKFFINPVKNLISVNGISTVPIYGISNISLPSTFNFIVQQITIINSSITTTPNYFALTSISGY